MTGPIDIIANAMHAAECGCGTAGYVSRNQAEVAAQVLTDERIIDHAVQHLSLTVGPQLSEADLRHVARVVLRSIGGA